MFIIHMSQLRTQDYHLCHPVKPTMFGGNGVAATLTHTAKQKPAPTVSKAKVVSVGT